MLNNIIYYYYNYIELPNAFVTSVLYPAGKYEPIVLTVRCLEWLKIFVTEIVDLQKLGTIYTVWQYTVAITRW